MPMIELTEGEAQMALAFLKDGLESYSLTDDEVADTTSAIEKLEPFALRQEGVK